MFGGHVGIEVGVDQARGGCVGGGHGVVAIAEVRDLHISRVEAVDRLVGVAVVAPGVDFAIVKEDDATAHGAAACGNVDGRSDLRVIVTTTLIMGDGLHGGTRGQSHSGHWGFAIVATGSGGRRTVQGVEDGSTRQRTGDGSRAIGVESDYWRRHGHVAELLFNDCRHLVGAAHRHGHRLEGGVGRVPLNGIPRGGDQRTVVGRGFTAVGGVADVIGLVEAGRHCCRGDVHHVAVNADGGHTWGGTLVIMGEGV